MQLWNVPKKESGFTLVEMLAAAVVVGILTALATPSLTGMLHRSRITDGTAKIVGAIKEAQKLAVRNSRACSIDSAPNGSGVFVVQTAAGSNPCLSDIRELHESLTVASSDAVTQISISSKGNIDYTNGGANPTAVSPREFTISHDVLTTNDRCVRIEGIFGNVESGLVINGVCDTDL